MTHDEEMVADKIAEVFPDLRGKLGFGCMRLPQDGGAIDIPQTERMVDEFLDAGFNYFDTAHGYLGGKSEPALKEALTSRHARDRYLIATKLTMSFFETEGDIRPTFESQLEALGVDRVDYYLLHALGAGNIDKFERCNAFELALALKREGKVKHVGISFHDAADLLEDILSKHPQVEFVQLQLNYLDWDDAAVQARKCYETCMRHGKPVVVMEPVKGGSLAQLPDEAAAPLDALGEDASHASFAMRFAGSLPGVAVVLSGMSDVAQMEDNIKTMQNLTPLNEEENAAINEVVRVLRSSNAIACTECRYCIGSCPMNIQIPDLFSVYNMKELFHNWNADYYYNQVYTKRGGRASDCIACGSCERECPQHLPIPELMKEVAEVFEGSK